MKKHLCTSVFLCTLLATSPAWGDADLDNLQNLAQQNFRLLSEDLGSALSYKAVSPAEPLGLTGFDVGFELTLTDVKNQQAWDTATNQSNSISTLPVPKIHLIKGLPFDIDIGASYAFVPGSNIQLLGLEVRYAILDGEGLWPALGVRYAQSKLSGVDQLDFSTSGYEFTVSKKLTLFTPYAGFGSVDVESDPRGSAASAGLVKEEFDLDKTFVGFNLNLALLNFAVEMDKTGDAQSVSAKFGWRF